MSASHHARHLLSHHSQIYWPKTKPIIVLGTANIRLIVGVPKEVKDHENRVSLIPRTVASLVASGIEIVAEAGAGAKSGFSDDEYLSAGAGIAGSAAELYSKADLIVKVKEIRVDKGEHRLLTQKHTVFAFNHFESSRELTEAAVKSNATVSSFEKVIDGNGQTPLLMPMSKIAGVIGGIWAGFMHNYAFRHDKSIRFKTGADEIRNRFISEFERIAEGNFNGSLQNQLSLHDRSVVIFGGGTVGEAAARTCSRLGCKLTIVEKQDARRRYLEELRLPRATITDNADFDILRSSTILIGATYARDKTEQVISEKRLKEISEVRKKVIIDISVDQGGNFPYLDPSSGAYAPEVTTSILNPGMSDIFGNTFVRVPNIPSMVPQYASKALSSALAPYVSSIARGIEMPEIARATSISRGRIIDPAILQAHDIKQP